MHREFDKDYERIAGAIRFMRSRYRDQPDLSETAAQTGLSMHHFQRMFSRWAGISPKRFLQYLTVEYAKSRIESAANLMDLSIRTGLSGPGRLHDLFVNLEAMSPGEFRDGGNGLTIYYGLHDSPFGNTLLAITERGVCNLHFIDTQNTADTERILRYDWPQARIVRDQDKTGKVNDRIFYRFESNMEPLSLLVKGTNFQVQVWRALLCIPEGSMTSYQEIAGMIDNPKASRAVGSAIANNPVAYLIPCHRVIRSTGEFGNYRWGLERKINMLGWEAGKLGAGSGCKLDKTG